MFIFYVTEYNKSTQGEGKVKIETYFKQLCFAVTYAELESVKISNLALLVAVVQHYYSYDDFPLPYWINFNNKI